MTVQVMPSPGETLAQGVARRVRGLMGEQRITGGRMAMALGLSQQAFSRRSTGSISFSLDEISVVAGVLGTSEAYLLGFAETRNPRPMTDGGDEVVRHEGLEPPTR